MKTQSEKTILKIKKSIFLKEVEKSAKYLGYSTPKVKFWETCDRNHFDNERAHIHLETNTICIPLTEFDFMSEEEIKETASHEVTHLYDAGHSNRFQNKRIDAQASLFRAPHGTMGVASEEKKEKKSKPKKERINKSKCNFHFCRKRRKTSQCPHCKMYFCGEHITPKEAGMNLVGNTDSRLSHLNSDDENAHPCFQYNNFLKRQEEKRDKEFIKALDKMKGKKNKPQINVEIKKIKKPKKKTTQTKKNIKKKIIKKENMVLESGLTAKEEEDKIKNKGFLCSIGLHKYRELNNGINFCVRCGKEKIKWH
tara:strand:- start:496 stop:1425 length:930 start_codon:yes stop_codon:yes gene_type:complete